MPTPATQQEIILVSGSRFANRQYIEKDTTDNQQNQSREEKFREACWNGILKEILPEIFLLSGNQPGMYMWQMREAQFILAMEMAAVPTDIDLYLSIDPYYFLEVQAWS